MKMSIAGKMGKMEKWEKWETVADMEIFRFSIENDGKYMNSARFDTNRKNGKMVKW